MGSVFSMLSELMYTSEKLIACFTCTMLITCIVATLIVVLAMGIGLGYNYCFVDIKTKHRYVPASYRYPGYYRYPYPNSQYNMYRARTTVENDLDPTLPPLAQTKDLATLPVPDLVITTSMNSTTTVNETTEKSTEAMNLTTTSIGVISTTTLNIINTTSLTSTSAGIRTVNVTDAKRVTVVKPVIDEKHADEQSELGPPPMVIPINGLDLIALLSKLRSENRNYSLQIVTT